MTIESNKTIARTFFEEFTNNNLQIVADLMSDDHMFYFPLAPEPQNKTMHVESQKRIKQSFPDYRFELIDQIAEGDLVLSRVILRGTQKGEFLGRPASNKTIEITVNNVMSFRDGLIVNEWDEFDTLSFLAQLGIVEKP